ncbi:MAG: NADP(H)-dependent aldo-keto reductase [Gammaproteobacteria bacterium]
MKYNKLGNTSIDVSEICLGTMTWGEQNSPAEAFEQLDYAVEAGINFIDAAELYPVPTSPKTNGDTERIIGDWMQQRKNRDQLILASKVCGRGEWVKHMRDMKVRLDRPNIESAINTSLKRLKTDYLDLYQLHWPDRSTNFFGKLGFTPDPNEEVTPMEETLDALSDLVKIGKIRHYGISNETAWGTMKYLNVAADQKQHRIVSIQNPYSLLNRTFEIGLSEVSIRENVGLLAYSPLGFGVLSGKYLNGQQPEGARLTLFKEFSRYTKEQGLKATEAYMQLAQDHDLDPAQMALAFVNTRPFLTSTIIGATTMDQLKTNIGSIDITLSEEVLAGIEAIHQKYPNPSP